MESFISICEIHTVLGVTYFEVACPDKAGRITPIHIIEYLFGKENTMLFVTGEKGQGILEYAIILFLAVLIITAVLWLLGFRLGDF
jgi:hypothetical protein